MRAPPCTNIGSGHRGTISVVLPNYNDGALIGRAVDAMLRQSRTPMEIIIVDDGSTDDSITIIEDLCARHKALQLITSSRNEGVVAAQNRGLTQVRGDYVFLAAADDLILDGFFESTASLLDAHPNSALALSDVLIRYANGHDHGKPVHMHLGLTTQPGYLTGAEFTRRHVAHPTHLLTSSILYRRALAESLWPLNEDLRWHADYFNNYVLALRHGLCHVPQPLTLRSEGGQSYSGKSRDWSHQKHVISRFFELLSAERFRDVASQFRQAAVTPDTRVRVTWMLAVRTDLRWYWTPALAKRLAWGAILHGLAPYVPSIAYRLYVKLFH